MTVVGVCISLNKKIYFPLFSSEPLNGTFFAFIRCTNHRSPLNLPEKLAERHQTSAERYHQQHFRRRVSRKNSTQSLCLADGLIIEANLQESLSNVKIEMEL